MSTTTVVDTGDGSALGLCSEYGPKRCDATDGVRPARTATVAQKYVPFTVVVATTRGWVCDEARRARGRAHRREEQTGCEQAVGARVGKPMWQRGTHDVPGVVDREIEGSGRWQPRPDYPHWRRRFLAGCRAGLRCLAMRALLAPRSLWPS